MQIQINSDHNVKDSPEFLSESDNFEKLIQNSLGHFQNNIMRVEVYFSDENAGKKGPKDKRCLIEARLRGTHPIVTSHNANDLGLALLGATRRLKHTLKHTIGKMKEH